jgi:hypothetical protein
MKEKKIMSHKKFLEEYLPKTDSKYSVHMWISKEEQELLLRRRGGYADKQPEYAI